MAATVLTPARVERGRLYYGNEIFAKGDAVAVFSELTKQEFYGSMHLLAQVRARAVAPFCAAAYSGVVPLAAPASTSTPGAASSAATTAAWPLLAAE